MKGSRLDWLRSRNSTNNQAVVTDIQQRGYGSSQPGLLQVLGIQRQPCDTSQSPVIRDSWGIHSELPIKIDLKMDFVKFAIENGKE